MDKHATTREKDDAQKYRQERVTEHSVSDVNVVSNVGEATFHKGGVSRD